MLPTFPAAINFTDVATIRIENLTVISRPHAMFSMLNCDDNTSVRLALKSSVYMIMDISAAIFNGIEVYVENYCTVFKIRLTSSTLYRSFFVSCHKFIVRMLYTKESRVY